MIVSFHVASGAAVGAAAGSRRRAIVLGLLAHALADRVPHWDISSRRFEIRSGAALLLLVALRRGAFDPATVGAVASSAPDVEHVVRLPRPRGRKLFPSHRFHGWHRAGGLPSWLQLLAAGALVGAVVGWPVAGRESPGREPPLP
jgi:hypothetical protein